ncbi:uncharacterized protein Mb2253c-like [Jatropha curcas]|uniref:uncharacterized protein Mb2253c-like n=1 Tax=Jatropha curcas TaxID=180498 RepID=UPI0005FBF6B4|nr:uncharacterized protein Mb2253c-like [Jatropha curcas]
MVYHSKGAGLGVLLESPQGEVIPTLKRLQFEVTNNMAEFEAYLFRLEALIAVKAEEVEVVGDSKLVIEHANGNWEVKEDRLKPYIDHLHVVVQNFKKVTFTHTSRVNNRVPDGLANLASDWEEISVMSKKPFMMSSGSIPCYKGKKIMDIEEEEKPWFYDVLHWMSKRVYPDSATRYDRRVI